MKWKCLLHNQMEWDCTNNFGMEIHAKRNKMDEESREFFEKNGDPMDTIIKSLQFISPDDSLIGESSKIIIPTNPS